MLTPNKQIKPNSNPRLGQTIRYSKFHRSSPGQMLDSNLVTTEGEPLAGRSKDTYPALPLALGWSQWHIPSTQYKIQAQPSAPIPSPLQICPWSPARAMGWAGP